MFGGEQRLGLEELAVVEEVLDDGVHVVGWFAESGDEGVEFEVFVGDGQVRFLGEGGGARRGCWRAGRTAAA